ncbi:hypothetical protein F8M41_002470 [Gigaspora margarita]|uniref:Uncharacterized protein n=1 Tax=Gigaspora margarita TaxID=4874 RepID=A0A8H4AYJ4_GIGMA|nr:hypothetical protein F8M41_002470 [Gigaspora margarita]
MNSKCTTDLIKDRIQLFSSYFLELNKLQNELKKYIICEKHHNQIIAKDNYLNYLKSKLSDYSRKRNRNFQNLSDNNNPILNEDQVKSKVDIGIQVNIDNNYNLIVQIDALTSSLANVVTDHAEQLQAIQNKNYKILGLEHKCEFLKKQVVDLNIQLKGLNSYQNQVEILTNEKNKLEIENINLKNSGMSDIILTKNVNQIFHCSLKAYNRYYNHITSGGDYTKFINCIESLAIEPKLLPDGFLILAFDNEQKGQKNYLDQGHNTVIYHTVTSFIALNFDSNNNRQSEINLWLRNSLSENEIAQLFYLSDDMKKELENELHYFINEIINKLNIEKYQEVNEINQLIKKQNNLNNKLKNVYIKQQESKISAIQKTVTSQNIKIPDLYIPDPIPVNSNSLANVQKVLEHIEIISRIKSGKHKWLPVLIWPYVSSHNNPTPNGYLEWAKNQTNETYKLKFEQSARRYPIYRLIEVSYEESLLYLKPHVRDIIKNVLVVSHSGLHNQHQGLDAVIEEINKALKSLIPPVPSQHHWEIAAKNFTNFTKQIGNDIWHPIPIKNENVMRKEELIAIINSVLVSIPEMQRPKYTNLKNKSKVMLLTILQEIRDLNNAKEIMNEENTG